MIHHKTICTQTDDIIIPITSLSAKMLQKMAANICKAPFLFLHYIPGKQKKKKTKLGNSVAREFKFRKPKKRYSF